MPFQFLVCIGRYLGLTRGLIKWRWTLVTAIVLYSINMLHPFFQEEMLASFERDIREQGLPTETVGVVQQKKKPRPKLPHLSTPNLLSPHVMESGSLSLRGWWMSHVKWEVTEMKRRSKPNVRQVFSVACTFNRIVETYQHLSLNKSIPIKGIKFYVSTTSWKMERPTDVLLRSYEPFYGARIFVVLSSGKSRLLKLDFLPESGKVMSNKAEFISPQGEQITSVTVMLGCFGYEGYVTFTDLAVKPIYDSKMLKTRTTYEPKHLLSPCQAPSTRPPEPPSDVLTELLYSSSSPTDADSITLVTQLTFNRIGMLKRSLRFWDGPVSVVIYVLLDEDGVIHKRKKEVRMRLPPRTFSKFSTASVVVIYGTEIGAQYPINRLRNIAIKNAKTQYIFMIDVDFIPSPDLEGIARDHLVYYKESNNNTDNTVAFVVPAFEGGRSVHTKDLPRTKEDVVRMVKRKRRLAPFRQIESPLSHSSTNYSQWYHSDEPYDVISYQDKYEPYLIHRSTPKLPLYDERFTGYGMNKISHVIELALLGYKFVVLPDVWIVHRHHPVSGLSVAHQTDPDLRFANRLKRFEFISDVYNKHKIGECKDVDNG